MIQRNAPASPQGERRVAICDLAASTMFEMLRPGRVWWVEDGAMPEDARLVGSEFNIVRGVWQFLVEHPSFDPVPVNVIPPELPPMTLHIEIRDAPPHEGEATDAR